MSIEEAKKMLEAEKGDSEGYHSVFDEIIETKLGEYDPDFMDALHKLYEESGESRWYG